MVMPALLTRMSSWPCCSSTSEMTRWQSAATPMLPWWMVDALVGGGELLGRVGAAGIPDGHPDAAVGELGADRQPDPAGAAGDERDLTLHTCHVRSSPVDLPTTS